jgi:hypothetical protein
MMKTQIDFDVDDVRFDFVKEARLSVEDSRELICIDVERIGSGYRAIINGREYDLPLNLPTIEDARKVAIELAIREISSSSTELAGRYLD